MFASALDVRIRSLIGPKAKVVNGHARTGSSNSTEKTHRSRASLATTAAFATTSAFATIAITATIATTATIAITATTAIAIFVYTATNADAYVAKSTSNAVRADVDAPDATDDATDATDDATDAKSAAS